MTHVRDVSEETSPIVLILPMCYNKCRSSNLLSVMFCECSVQGSEKDLEPWFTNKSCLVLKD